LGKYFGTKFANTLTEILSDLPSRECASADTKPLKELSDMFASGDAASSFVHRRRV
jgi:hypothetical protein